MYFQIMCASMHEVCRKPVGHNDKAGPRKITRSQKASNHEILGAQHLSFCEIVSFLVAQRQMPDIYGTQVHLKHSLGEAN